MEILKKEINNDFEFIQEINSKNKSFFLKINNKDFIAKIIYLDNDEYSKEKIIKTNQNIINIYNSFISKNIVLPFEKYQISEFKNDLYLFTLSKKVFGDLSDLPNLDIDFYQNITYQVLNILFVLLDENIVYFDIKIQNFLIHHQKVYITDFEEDYIKKIIFDNQILMKTILTLQFYLYYLSFRKHYPDFSFFQEIRFFGSKEKILDFFFNEKFYDYLFEYLIFDDSDFLLIIENYLTTDYILNYHDICFIKKLNEKNYLKNIII